MPEEGEEGVRSNYELKKARSRLYQRQRLRPKTHFTETEMTRSTKCLNAVTAAGSPSDQRARELPFLEASRARSAAAERRLAPAQPPRRAAQTNNSSERRRSQTGAPPAALGRGRWWTRRGHAVPAHVCVEEEVGQPKEG